MGKTMSRKPENRSTELLLLFSIIALLLYFTTTKRKADIVTKEVNEKATLEYAIRIWGKLPIKVQDTIFSFPKNLLSGMTHSFESERMLNARVELWGVEHCLKQDPDNIEWLRKRAYALGDLGKLSAAIQDLDRILYLDPNDYNALQLHSIYAAKLGLREVFIDDLEKLENIYQKKMGAVPASLLKSRAHYLAEDGRFEEALAVARRADFIEPNDIETSDTLGNIYIGLGEHQSAIEAYSRAIGLSFESLYVPRGMK